MLKEDILDKNIPIYLKALVETLIAIQEKEKRGTLGWKIKFDPRYSFYIYKRNYMIARGCVIEKMDEYFKRGVEEKIFYLNNK